MTQRGYGSYTCNNKVCGYQLPRGKIRENKYMDGVFSAVVSRFLNEANLKYEYNFLNVFL